MSLRRDIDDALRDWPHSPGIVSARLVQAEDGRDVLQMRIELGVLQMETAGRPDGRRPEGAETYLDYLIQRAARKDPAFTLSQEQCTEVDREFLQFYHRRLCWLALRRYRQAVDDADHTLALMDFVADHAPSDSWTLSHEQHRPLVLFHRTQAAALAALEEWGPEAAVGEIDRGLSGLRETVWSLEPELDFDQHEMSTQLHSLRRWLSRKCEIGGSLDEQLAEAIAAEEYELAAKLRDEIARRRAQHV